MKEDLHASISATESQGICAYYVILDEPRSGASIAGRIRVIPGGIEYNANRYSGVQDFGFNPLRERTPYVRTETRPP